MGERGTTSARSAAIGWLLVAAFATPAARAQTPFLVSDINAHFAQEPSDPHDFVAVGATVFFVASTFDSGAELWRSDGAADGAALVKDIVPGAEGSDPSSLADFDGTLIFFATTDGVLGLWRSDGTDAGTALVEAFPPDTRFISGFTVLNDALYFATSGAESSQLWRTDGTTAGTTPLRAFEYAPSRLLAFDGALLFRVDGYGHVGQALWRSDGTAAGTVRLKAFNGGFDISIERFSSPLARLGDGVVLLASSTTGALQLWRSDGTEAGTVPVRTFPTFHGQPTLLTAMGDSVFFFAPTSFTLTTLWRSDGTEEGTVAVGDVPASSIAPSQLVAAGDLLFFDVADDDHGVELWRSDGTAAGTFLLRDIYPGSEGSYPDSLRDVGGTLLFSADDSVHGRELWRSDGSAAGTMLLRDIAPGTSSSTPYALTAIDERTLLFSADDGVHGRELWRSDASDGGTELVDNIAPDDRSTLGAAPTDLVDLGGRLLFRADDGVHGSEIWRSDGTPGGTVLVKDIHPGPEGSRGESFTALFGLIEGIVYFWADDGSHGVELWQSDGTADGTSLLADIAPGPASSFAYPVGSDDGTIFVAANDGAHGVELWKSDRTTAGTVLVADLNPGPGNSYPNSLTNVNGTLFLSTVRAGGGGELWRTDGTAAGTTLVRAFAGFYQISGLTAFGDRLVFAADDGVHGDELWASDGSADGTILLANVFAGSRSSFPAELTAFRGVLYFQAAGSLWRTDGTPTGTSEVAEISFGDPSCRSPFGLTVVGDTLFFRSCIAFGTELWASDGTAAGTVPLQPVSGGPIIDPAVGAAIDGVLVFPGYDIEHGIELWRSDGTAAGTGRLIDLDPGIDSSYPALFKSSDGQVLFQACIANRCAPWATDGTAAGTRRLGDLDHTGPFQTSGDLVFFAAADRFHGDELWAVSRAELACPGCTPTPTATPNPTATPPHGSSGGGCAVASGSDGASCVWMSVALLLLPLLRVMQRQEGRASARP